MSARSTPMFARATVSGVTIALILAALQSAHAGDPARVRAMSIAELKGVYLGCEQSSTESRLDTGDVMYCSLVYEELKEKGFGGEFWRIRSWLEGQSAPMG